MSTRDSSGCVSLLLTLVLTGIMLCLNVSHVQLAQTTVRNHQDKRRELLPNRYKCSREGEEFWTRWFFFYVSREFSNVSNVNFAQTNPLFSCYCLVYGKRSDCRCRPIIMHVSDELFNANEL